MKDYVLKKKKQEKSFKVAKFSVDSSFSSFETLAKLSFHAARLYNSTLYETRQYFFANAEYLNYEEAYHKVKANENYSLLLTDIGQLTIRLVDRDMKSFFALLKLKQQGKYLEKVNIPNYKDKNDGMTFTIHGRSVKIKDGKASFGLTKDFVEKYKLDYKRIEFNIPKHIQYLKSFAQVRIVPKYDGKIFDIEFVYEDTQEKIKLDKTKILSIDMGLDNFATLFSPGLPSEIIDGRKLKSINQYFNKVKAKLQQQYDKTGTSINTRRFIRLSKGRKNRINDFFNKAINHIINKCVQNDIGTLVIGDFSGCKDEINLGSKTNQNFVSIPHGTFKEKLKAKCISIGIDYVLQEESYTSKCSSLDLEEIKKHDEYLGKRIERGLFRTSDGTKINADLNGAVNILRKYKSKSNEDLSLDDVRAVVTPPTRILGSPSL